MHSHFRDRDHYRGHGAALRAEDAKPSWACLPDDTVGLLRIPSGNKAADTLRTKTRIGALLFDPQRVANVREAMAKEGSDDLEQASEMLGRYGLKLDDIYKLFEGEAGAGVVLPPGDPRLIAVLSWIEPEEELTGRLMTALDKVLEENKDNTDLIKRNDIELAGKKVIHLTIKPPDVEEDEIEVKPGEEKIRVQEFKTPKFEVLISQRGSRLLVGEGFVIGRGKEAEESGRERLKEMFARFLATHEAGDSGPKLNYLEAAGVRSALPGGLPLIELMVDFKQLMKLLEMPQAEQAKAIIKACGLDELGVFVYRSTFENSLMRSGAFLGAAAPRNGLLALLDQPTVNGQPPAWVPAELNSFSQLSFDLGKAYSRIKQIVIDQGGDAARNNFDLVELQVNQLLQTDIASLLSALGTHHSSVDLPPRKTDVAQGAEGLAGLTGSSVFVWKLTDEALWKRRDPNRGRLGSERNGGRAGLSRHSRRPGPGSRGRVRRPRISRSGGWRQRHAGNRALESPQPASRCRWPGWQQVVSAG